MEIVSPSYVLKLSFGLLQGLIFFLLVDHDKEYMKLNVGSMASNITRRSCIPTNSMKSGNDYFNLDYNFEIGAYVESSKINLAYLVG